MILRIYDGQRFGRLTAIAYHGKDAHNNKLWFCECDCGNVKIARGERLIAGKTRSCGCIVREGIQQSTHGGSKTPLYSKWLGMRARCYRKANDHYQYYGGRGLGMCKDWQDFAVFRDWAHSHGYDDGLSIERRDNDKGYSPDNCTWIPLADQAKNKRTNLRITIGCETKIAAEWARVCGVRDYVIYQRYRSGDRGQRLLRPVQNHQRTAER